MTAKLSYSRTLGSRKAGAFVFILSASLMLVSSYLFAAEKVAGSEPARYRVESLRDISAEQGKKYLAEAEIGTVSQLPGPNTLLITAQPRELIKASAILRLVDSKEKFVIKTIFPTSAARNLPSNEQIAAEVGNISIGTFSNPPTPAAETKAIIDIHNDAVIVIAPAEQLEKIITAIEQAPTLQKDGKIGTQQLQTRALGPVPYAPNEPGVTNDEPQDANESDEFFSKLLSSLSEAEKAAAELAKQPAKPSESSVVATVPEQEEQGKPFAGSEQVSEKSDWQTEEHRLLTKLVNTENNEQEVFNQTLAICTDIIGMLRHSSRQSLNGVNDINEPIYFTQDQFTIEPFQERFDNLCCGYVFNIGVLVQNDFQTCDIPAGTRGAGY